MEDLCKYCKKIDLSKHNESNKIKHLKACERKNPLSKKRLGESKLTSYWNMKPTCADAMDEFCSDSTKTNVGVSCTSVNDINNEQAEFLDSVELDVAFADEPTPGRCNTKFGTRFIRQQFNHWPNIVKEM